MQITLNQEEVQTALQAHVDILVNVAGDAHITVNEDGTALVIIGEDLPNDDAPFETESDKPRQRRKRRSPAEAKHVPVEAKKELEQPAEIQTLSGGQSESSTQEAEGTAAPEVQGEKADTPEQTLKEEATEQAEEAASEEASQEAEVKQEVQEEKAAEAPAAKPSLFANLKR